MSAAPVTLRAVLDQPQGRAMVDQIEDVTSSLRAYPNGDATLERIRAALVSDLFDLTGFFYSSEVAA